MSGRNLDDIKMWLGNEEKSNVSTVFVQPGVVSSCSVFEQISFVNSFAAVSRKGVLEFVWVFSCWTIFEARFQRYAGL